VRKPALAAGKNTGAGAQESGMIDACQRHDDRAASGIRIAFPGFAPARPSRGSSAIPTPASSPSPGAQKNGLRDLRAGAARVVRPQAAPRPVTLAPSARRARPRPDARGSCYTALAADSCGPASAPQSRRSPLTRERTEPRGVASEFRGPKDQQFPRSPSTYAPTALAPIRWMSSFDAARNLTQPRAGHAIRGSMWFSFARCMASQHDA